MIQLYIRHNCPYCQKVLRKTEEMNLQEGVDYQLIDAAQGTPGREVVLKIGGKAMVPFLIDGDTNMYESEDIIAYIQKKLG